MRGGGGSGDSSPRREEGDERWRRHAPEEEDGLLQFLGLAVLGGLLALLMPCTYPMIPITISFFTKQASQRLEAIQAMEELGSGFYLPMHWSSR